MRVLILSSCRHVLVQRGKQHKERKSVRHYSSWYGEVTLLFLRNFTHFFKSAKATRQQAYLKVCEGLETDLCVISVFLILL